MDQNHFNDSIDDLCRLVKEHKGNEGVDPDALREAFLSAMTTNGLSIPAAKEHIKSKYNLYPPVDPSEEDKDL